MRSPLRLRGLTTLLLAVSITLTACGSSTTETQPPSDTPTTATETSRANETDSTADDAAVTATPTQKAVVKPSCTYGLVPIGRYVLRYNITDIVGGTGMEPTGFFAKAIRIPSETEAKDPVLVEDIEKQKPTLLDGVLVPQVDLELDVGSYESAAGMTIEPLEDTKRSGNDEVTVFCIKETLMESTKFFIE